jgi:hypothetical protein
MFPGFFVGTIFLFWLVRTLMWGPRHRYYGYRRPWGPGPFDAGESLWGDFGGSDRSYRPREAEPASPERGASSRGRESLDEAVGRFVRALRDRLRATPAQEKAFDAAVTKLRGAIDEVQTRMKEARDDIARSVRNESFDDAAFDDATRRIGDAMHAIRGAARSALVDLHDQLDERQRETLVDLIGSSRVDL